MLTLPEELMLFALDDVKGTILSSAHAGLTYGLAAAGVVELLFAGRLRIEEKQRLAVVDGSPTGDELLDEMLARIQESGKPRSMKDWIRGFGSGKVRKLRDRAAARLVERGLVREESGRHLGIFPWRHYPTMDGGQKLKSVERVRAVVLGEADPDARTMVLIGLLSACKLLERQFSKDEWKLVKPRVKELSKGEFAGKAVKEVVDANIAAMAAISAAATAASISSSAGSN